MAHAPAAVLERAREPVVDDRQRRAAAERAAEHDRGRPVRAAALDRGVRGLRQRAQGSLGAEAGDEVRAGAARRAPRARDVACDVLQRRDERVGVRVEPVVAVRRAVPRLAVGRDRTRSPSSSQLVASSMNARLPPQRGPIVGRPMASASMNGRPQPLAARGHDAGVGAGVQPGHVLGRDRVRRSVIGAMRSSRGPSVRRNASMRSRTWASPGRTARP